MQHSAKDAECPDPDQSCYDVEPHPALSAIQEGLTIFWILEPIDHALSPDYAIGKLAPYVDVTTPR